MATPMRRIDIHNKSKEQLAKERQESREKARAIRAEGKGKASPYYKEALKLELETTRDFDKFHELLRANGLRIADTVVFDRDGAVSTLYLPDG